MYDPIFGDLFDFNGDGSLDALEAGAELAFLQELTKEENEEDECSEE